MIDLRVYVCVCSTGVRSMARWTVVTLVQSKILVIF